MKRFIFLCLLSIPVALFAQNGDNEYVIKGTIVNETGKKYLDKLCLRYEHDGVRYTDTVKLAGDTFEFRGLCPFAEPTPVFLDIILAPIEIERGKTVLTFNKWFFLEPVILTATLTDGIEVDPNNPNEGYMKIAKGSAITGSKNNDENDRLIRLFFSMPENEFRVMADRYITENPDSWISYIGLYGSVLNGSKDPETMQALLDRFSERLRNSTQGKKRQEQINAMKFTSIGAVAPDFTLPDVDSNPVSLSDFRGQWVLVDFWASWCDPCRAENPNLVAAYEQLKDKNFTILGVSLDAQKKDWLAAIEKDNLTWTHVIDFADRDSQVAKLYNVTGIPTNYLINPDGVIVAKNLRGKQLTVELAKCLGQM